MAARNIRTPRTDVHGAPSYTHVGNAHVLLYWDQFGLLSEATEPASSGRLDRDFLDQSSIHVREHVASSAIIPEQVTLWGVWVPTASMNLVAPGLRFGRRVDVSLEQA
eukprot:3821796-Prymnesium_polylepis.1